MRRGAVRRRVRLTRRPAPPVADLPTGGRWLHGSELADYAPAGFEELQQTLDLHGGRLDRIEDNQRRMQDSQCQQFEHLSAQMAEILGVLRGPAAADPAPESER